MKNVPNIPYRNKIDGVAFNFSKLGAPLMNGTAKANT